MAKVRRNFTLTPQTVDFLAGTENASEYLDQIVELRAARCIQVVGLYSTAPISWETFMFAVDAVASWYGLLSTDAMVPHILAHTSIPRGVPVREMQALIKIAEQGDVRAGLVELALEARAGNRAFVERHAERALVHKKKSRNDS